MTKSGKGDKQMGAKMQTLAQRIADILSEAKTASFETLALVVIQVADEKIVDFNLVDVTNDVALGAQLTEMVNVGWIPIGLFIITAPDAGVRQVTVREFVDDPGVVKFLKDLMDSSHAYYDRLGRERSTSSKKTATGQKRRRKAS